ncbi:MAG: hypothetical protein WBP13_04630 [Methylophilaceae bacterium]
MPFSISVENVTYHNSDQGSMTVVEGTLLSGEIVGPEWVKFDLAGSGSYALKMIGMDVCGPFTDSGLRNLPGKIGKVSLVLDGHAPNHALKAPTVVEAVGRRKPKLPQRLS